MSKVRRWEIVTGCALALALLVPLLIYGPIDQEELALGIFASQVHYQHLLRGEWLFWLDNLGFGTPLPLGHRLDAHPIFALSAVAPLRIALSATWIAHLVVAVVYFLRLLAVTGIRAPLRMVLLLCYLGSVATVSWFYLNDWVTFVIGWTLFPVLLYSLHQAVVEPERNRWLTAGTLAALFAFLVVNSHPGYIAPLAISLTAYTLAAAPLRRRVYVTLACAFALCLSISAERLYYFASEMSMFPATAVRESQPAYGLRDYASALVAPLAAVDSRLRLPFIGVVLGAAALVSLALRRWRGNAHQRGCAVAFVVAVALSLTPHTALSWTASSGSWLFRDPMLIFGYLLAGVLLQRMIDSPRIWVRRLTYGLLAVQIGQQAWVLKPGFERYDFYKQGLEFYRHQGTAVGIGKLLVDAARQAGPRVYLSRDVNKLSRAAMSSHGIHASTDLSLLGLNPVNGWFKSTSMDALYPSNALMHGFIGGEPDVLQNLPLLNALGIDLVLMAEDEGQPAAGLDLLARQTFELERRPRTLLLFRNPTAWPTATLLAPAAATLVLPRRPGCSHRRALCRSFDAIVEARLPGDASVDGRNGHYRIHVTPSDDERVLFLSMLHRPEWRASGAGTPLAVTTIGGAFLGVRVPPGIEDVDLVFDPWRRRLLAWFSGLSGAALLSFLAVAWLRRQRSAASR